MYARRARVSAATLLDLLIQLVEEANGKTAAANGAPANGDVESDDDEEGDAPAEGAATGGPRSPPFALFHNV